MYSLNMNYAILLLLAWRATCVRLSHSDVQHVTIKTPLQDTKPVDTRIVDPASAYAYPHTWATVDKLDIKTFITPETGNNNWTTVYNNKRGQPKKTMGVCIDSVDYKTPMNASCGAIHVRGLSSRTAALKGLGIKLYTNSTYGPWRGRRKILLGRSPFEESRIRNAVGYDMLRHIPGFVSVGLGFVHLFVNGEDYGLYQVLESIDGNYLENHGLNRTDTLLKADNYTWAPLPASVIAPPQWLREMNRGNDMHWAEDINSIALLLKDGFDKKDCVGVERVIKQYFDVDQLVDYIAINTILLEGDQTYHNYLLHRRQGEVKWRHFFWDKDGALDLFRSPQKIKNYNTFKFGVSYKNGVMVHLRYQPNYLLQNFLNAKGMYEKVHKKVLEFTDKKTGLLNGKRFTTTISNFSKRVRPFVEKGKADKITHKVFDAEIKRLKKVYAHPEKLWEEFEVKWWGKNGTAPTCGEWS